MNTLKCVAERLQHLSSTVSARRILQFNAFDNIVYVALERTWCRAAILVPF